MMASLATPSCASGKLGDPLAAALIDQLGPSCTRLGYAVAFRRNQGTSTVGENTTAPAASAPLGEEARVLGDNSDDPAGDRGGRRQVHARLHGTLPMSGIGYDVSVYDGPPRPTRVRHAHPTCCLG